MTKLAKQVEAVSEIRVEPQPSGLRAVYLVETRTEKESQEIGEMFGELATRLEVRQLCNGKLVSYAVQAHESDTAFLDEIEDVLRRHYGFVVTQRSFDQVIYRIVTELTHDTGSKLIPVPICDICGKVEPFPNVVVSLAGEDGSEILSRNYCARCTAEVSASNNKEFVKSLLAADRREFGKLAHADLVRHPSRKRPLRFRIKSSI